MEFQKRKIVHFRNEFVLFRISRSTSIHSPMFRNTCPFSNDTIQPLNDNKFFSLGESGRSEISSSFPASIDRSSPPGHEIKRQSSSREQRGEREEGRGGDERLARSFLGARNPASARALLRTRTKHHLFRFSIPHSSNI